jgi:hypothetical protein
MQTDSYLAQLHLKHGALESQISSDAIGGIRRVAINEVSPGSLKKQRLHLKCRRNGKRIYRINLTLK